MSNKKEATWPQGEGYRMVKEDGCDMPEGEECPCERPVRMVGEATMVGRGSDDDYCAGDPADGHHYVSHSVQAPPIRWVEVCSLCRHISSRALREQLGESEDHIIELTDTAFTIQHPMACRPNLFACPMNQAARELPEKLPVEPGRYVCTLGPDGVLVTGARVVP